MECPIAFGSKDLEALRKRFSCEADVLLTTAFGVTVSVWNADTKAFFPTGGGKRPVLVEWTPDQSLEELVRNRQEQAEGAARFGDYTYEDCVRDMAPGFSASFDGPDDPETAVGDDALAFRLTDAGKGGFKLVCQFRSDQYSEGILQQFADSFSACLLSMEKADKVSDLAFATEKQVAETDSFNPEPFPGDPDVTLLDLFRENVAKYPGVGGLKTVNVRSLGSEHVGIFLDGVQVDNAQNMQVDLGRFSTDGLAMVSLYNGQKTKRLLLAAVFVLHHD